MLTEPLRAIQELLATNTELIHTQSKTIEALRERILELDEENKALYQLLQTRGKAKQAPVCRAQPGLWMVGKRKKPGRKPSPINREMAEWQHRLLVEVKDKKGCANLKEAAVLVLRWVAKNEGVSDRWLNSLKGKDVINGAADLITNRLRNRNSLK